MQIGRIAKRILLLGGPTGLLLWLFARSSSTEPVYKGQRLRVWTERLAWRSFTGTPSEPKEAVLQIGTNGIQFYFEWIQHSQSSPSAKLSELFARRLGGKDTVSPKSERADGACAALCILVAHADAVVPRLQMIVEETKSSEVASRVAITLARLGASGNSALISLMRNRSLRHRMEVIEAAAAVGANRSQLLPALVDVTLDPSPEIRAAAQLSIERIENLGSAQKETPGIGPP
jgi:hypothetical protein